jgi:hypothetical protein
MSETNDFYTYAYLRGDGTPYYIGRGKGRRAFETHRTKNRKFNPPSEDRILFLKSNLTFEESVRHEVYMIFVLGRKDTQTGILRNLTDGGEGTLNRVWSTEERGKLRQANLGKEIPEEVKSKIQRALQGKPWSEKRRAAKEKEEASENRSKSQTARREKERKEGVNVSPSTRGKNHHTLKNDPIWGISNQILSVWEDNGRPKDYRTLCKLLQIPKTKKVMSVLKILLEETRGD